MSSGSLDWLTVPVVCEAAWMSLSSFMTVGSFVAICPLAAARLSTFTSRTPPANSYRNHPSSARGLSIVRVRVKLLGNRICS